MYYTHDLRTNLQEWRNRLYKASYSQFGSQFLFFFKSIDNEPILLGLIEEASRKHGIDLEYASNWFDTYDNEILFDNEDLRIELGKKARDFILANHTWKSNVAIIINSYSKLVSSKKNKA